LRLKITYENDRETNVEVKQGSLEVIPLLYGQTARIHLHPLHHYDVGMGMPGRGGSLGGAHGLRGIKGSALGVIVDARGRPLSPSNDLAKRSELVKNWLSKLSGS
jgi:ribosomal protein L13E